MKAAAGKDGITVKMVNREVFVELWWELFNWCWGSGMVPSMWKSSIVLPVPKTRSKGACRTEELRGISLVSVVYKAMCLIVLERLVKVVEKGNYWWRSRCLQEGKRMSRSDSDLTLLGQTMMLRKKKGVLVAAAS